MLAHTRGAGDYSTCDRLDPSSRHEVICGSPDLPHRISSKSSFDISLTICSLCLLKFDAFPASQ